MTQRIILIESEAPAKPALGAPCNGCGLCCLHAPCPLGVLVSRRWRGACAALRWDAVQRRYQCGLLVPAHPPRRPTWWRSVVRALVRRWIAAGQGCDAEVVAENIPHGRDWGPGLAHGPLAVKTEGSEKRIKPTRAQGGADIDLD